MRKFILSALALVGMGATANAQFSVYDNEGKVLFTMEDKPAYVDFTYQPKFRGTVGNAVDLGLPSGTLWADHNIGATNEEDYGDYFA